jgi:histidyl-tRNA synthetase
MINLTPKMKKALEVIDPYFSQKVQGKIAYVSTNRIIELRQQAGLYIKDKGRPKRTRVLFAGQQRYPKEVLRQVHILRQEVINQKYEQRKKAFEKQGKTITKEEIEAKAIPLEKLL